MGKNKYTEKDAGNDTGSSVKSVKEAWHDARESASKSGDLKERGNGRGPQDQCNYGHKK